MKPTKAQIEREARRLGRVGEYDYDGATSYTKEMYRHVATHNLKRNQCVMEFVND